MHGCVMVDCVVKTAIDNIVRWTIDHRLCCDQAYELIRWKDVGAAVVVIEHVFDPVQTLTQLHDLLKPGGQLLISIPNAGCWEPFIFRSAWYVWELPRHLQHFTPSKIRSVLRRAGFADVRVIHQRNLLNIIGSLGILLKRFFLTRWLGEWLLRYPDSPRMWIQLMLSPVAHLLAAIRQ